MPTAGSKPLLPMPTPAMRADSVWWRVQKKRSPWFVRASTLAIRHPASRPTLLGRSMARHLPLLGKAANRPLNLQENIMGKYFLAWLLGVPFFVLVILYLFFH